MHQMPVDRQGGCETDRMHVDKARACANARGSRRRRVRRRQGQGAEGHPLEGKVRDDQQGRLGRQERRRGREEQVRHHRELRSDIHTRGIRVGLGALPSLGELILARAVNLFLLRRSTYLWGREPGAVVSTCMQGREVGRYPAVPQSREVRGSLGAH